VTLVPELQAFWLENEQLRVCVINLGLRTHQIFVNVEGHWIPTLRTLPSVSDHATDTAAFGALVGRVAGRIRGASLTLDEKEIGLDRNHGDHHIHGGERGMTQGVWRVEPAATSLRAYLVSLEGEMGYPGQLSISCEIRLIDSTVHYTLEAESTQRTCFNPTWHHYFCLGESEDFGTQRLWLNASVSNENDSSGIALNRAFRPRALGDRAASLRDWVSDPHPQIRQFEGLDHYFQRAAEGPLAILEEGLPRADDRSPDYSNVSQRPRIRMSLSASTPGLQVYSGQKLGTTGPGLALEPMVVPDAIHHANLAPEVTLEAHTLFERSMSCEFSLIGR
jgi:aldose 1-epimerase